MHALSGVLNFVDMNVLITIYILYPQALFPPLTYAATHVHKCTRAAVCAQSLSYSYPGVCINIIFLHIVPTLLL